MSCPNTNCGTWADVIRVPSAVLEDGRSVELHEFLRELLRGGLRSTPATYADLRLEPDGLVSCARLERCRAI